MEWSLLFIAVILRSGRARTIATGLGSGWLVTLPLRMPVFVSRIIER